jgi:predicted protein tyrosine phosphatase
LAHVEEQVRRHRPAGVVSLLGPDEPVPALPDQLRRLALAIHDIVEPREGFVAADAQTVERLLAFAEETPADSTLLVHCWMGISRSPAAAFILACARAPERPEDAIASELRLASPSATPNSLLVSLADQRLGRGGRMRAAIASIGRGCEAATGAPFALDI